MNVACSPYSLYQNITGGSFLGCSSNNPITLGTINRFSPLQLHTVQMSSSLLNVVSVVVLETVTNDASRAEWI